jgi:glutamate--cysteine ligase
MASPYRSLDIARLRQDLLENAFVSPRGESEVHGAWAEFFAVRWDDGGSRPIELARRELVDVVAEAATRIGAEFTVSARPRCDAARSQIGVGFGQKVWIATPLAKSPSECHEAFDRGLIALRSVCSAARVELVALGADPWRAVDESEAPDDLLDREREEFFAASEGPGLAALRLTARTGVVLGWGNAVTAPLRWKAAQFIAPFANALFAHSPVVAGSHQGLKSFGARAWRLAAPDLTAPPPTFADGPDGDRAAQYLTFALEARTSGIEGRPRFGSWVERPIGGKFPELADWRLHLESLCPPVRPTGNLELVFADTQPRAFSLAPLAFAAALLDDSASLPRVLERHALRSRELARRYEIAERDGFTEPIFASDSKALVALAADALLRAPSTRFGGPLRVAFVHFAERCALRSRTPADELLDVLLRRGELDRGALYEHERRLLQPLAFSRAS